jgi:anti-sigma factor RsiW
LATCWRYGKLLSPFVDGELEADEAASVADHIEGCDGCRSEVEAYQGLEKAALAVTAAPPVSDLEWRKSWAVVSAAIAAGAADAEAFEDTAGEAARRFVQRLIPLAAAALLMLSALCFYTVGEPTPRGAESAAPLDRIVRIEVSGHVQ